MLGVILLLGLAPSCSCPESGPAPAPSRDRRRRRHRARSRHRVSCYRRHPAPEHRHLHHRWLADRRKQLVVSPRLVDGRPFLPWLGAWMLANQAERKGRTCARPPSGLALSRGLAPVVGILARSPVRLEPPHLRCCLPARAGPRHRAFGSGKLGLRRCAGSGSSSESSVAAHAVPGVGSFVFRGGRRRADRHADRGSRPRAGRHGLVRCR